MGESVLALVAFEVQRFLPAAGLLALAAASHAIRAAAPLALAWRALCARRFGVLLAAAPSVAAGNASWAALFQRLQALDKLHWHQDHKGEVSTWQRLPQRLPCFLVALEKFALYLMLQHMRSFLKKAILTSRLVPGCAMCLWLRRGPA